MLAVLCVIKHHQANGNLRYTVLFTKAKPFAPVFCKMQTQYPKNNPYLAAVIIIGNASENSSPHLCVNKQ